MPTACRRCGGDGRDMRTPGGGFDLNPGNRMYDAGPCSRCVGSGSETIAEFFVEYDKRVRTDPVMRERIGALRPALVSRARSDPKGFVREIADFFAELGLT
jgi:hypothetical protein